MFDNQFMILIVNALPKAALNAFGMIFSSNINTAFAGVLYLIGLIYFCRNIFWEAVKAIFMVDVLHR